MLCKKKKKKKVNKVSTSYTVKSLCYCYVCLSVVTTYIFQMISLSFNVEHKLSTVHQSAHTGRVYVIMRDVRDVLGKYYDVCTQKII